MSAFHLLFLGTRAADFGADTYRDCPDRFDPDVRRASSTLLNGHILLDCGPHCPDSLRIAGIDPSVVTDLLVTHLHSDHFCPASVEKIASSAPSGIRLWVRSDAVLPEIPGVTVVRMEPYARYEIGNGLFVTGLEANHDYRSFPQFLLLEGGGKRLLYALDGAWFLNRAVDHLKKHSPLDLWVADATVGDYAGDIRLGEHNSIPMIRLMIPSLRTLGILNDTSSVILSHLAPTLHKPHAETARIASDFGALVAFDGMEVEV